ncbi:MAG: hypothetical protein AcusKO_31970 [Acuticoccus sp.]
MMRQRLVSAIAAAALLGAAASASAQSTYDADAKDLSGSLEAEEAGADLRPLPLGCVAIAVDTAEGGEGNGQGKTLEEARHNAMQLCEQSGGKNCVVEASSCNPDG